MTWYLKKIQRGGEKVNKSREKELESLVVLLETKDVLLPHEIKIIWGFEKSTAGRYIRDFIAEFERADSKLPKSAYIYHSQKLKWVDRKAFRWFMEEYVNLTDEVRRKEVRAYKN